MAIINSAGVGKAVKSQGNLTYKTVRGRTIASQRITTNASQSPDQINQRISFTSRTKTAKLLQSWINLAFDKSKFGSQRNHFMTLNKKFNLAGYLGEVQEGIIELGEAFAESFVASGTPAQANIQYTSFGSATCIVNETASTIPSYKYSTSGDPISNLPCDSKIEVLFPSPLEPSKIDVYAAQFSKTLTVTKLSFEGGETQEGNMVDPSFPDMPLAFMKATFTEDINGLITSITFEPGTGSSAYGVIVVPIVRVEGKCITLNRAFAVTNPGE